MNTTTYKFMAAVLAVMSIFSLTKVIRDISGDAFRISELLTCVALGFLASIAFLTSKLREKAKKEGIEIEEERPPASKEIYKRIAWIGVAHIAIISVLLVITSLRNE